jgi:PiT family inorganic phosphate transporter
MGVVVLALTVGGYHTGDSIPLWVYFLTAATLAAGTYAGGWRIMRTLGRRIIELDPPHGFAAESTASSVLFVAAIGYGVPISTTHTITAAIMGVGATKRLSAVRWGVAGNIVTAWIFTMPGAAWSPPPLTSSPTSSSADPARPTTRPEDRLRPWGMATRRRDRRVGPATRRKRS